MYRLIVTDFGPLSNVDVTINDISVFIGPQASGKSTIAKLIYYFLSVKDDLSQYYVSYITNNKIKRSTVIISDIKKRLRYKFVQLFGTTKHLTDFKIAFYYSDENYIQLLLDKDKFVSASFSNNIEKRLMDINSNLYSYIQEILSQNSQYMTQESILVQNAKQRQILLSVSSQINSIIGEDNVAIYIPACRSILATLSDYIYNLINEKIFDDKEEHSTYSYSIDYATKTFIDKITHLKKAFIQSLDEMVIERRKFADSNTSIPNELLEKVKRLSQSILKGEYRYSYNEERLYYSKEEYVKFSFSSSGQQEATWIVLLIFMQILNNINTTILIEEPEAHLYPEAQMYIMQLIALFANYKSNKVIITTHSPYTLTTLNTFIQAHNIGQNVSKKNQVNNVIPRDMWIDYNRLSAFMLRDKQLYPLLDNELKQIKAEEIDDVSNIINENYYKLSEIAHEM